MLSPARSLTKGAAAAIVVLGVLAAGAGAVALGIGLRAGSQGDGTSVTPTGWSVTPAGVQTQLESFPTDIALSPDGSRLLVVNTGQGTQSIQLLDASSHTMLDRIEYAAPEGLFAGLVWSADGRQAFASAGGRNQVHRYDVEGGELTERDPVVVAAPEAEDSFVTQIAVSRDGATLYAAEQRGDSLAVVDLAGGDVTRVKVGPRPYGVLLAPDERSVFVSNQGADTVSVVRVGSGAPAVEATVEVGTHPDRMVLDPRSSALYVANADSDSVTVLDRRRLRAEREIDLSPYPGAEVGSNPTALALSRSGRRLYVANAGNNDVAVVRLGRGRGGDEILGMIPTAWYPTATALAPDGRSLYVLNAKGLGAGPNPGGPNPESADDGQYTDDQFIHTMTLGTLSRIAVPSRPALADYTDRVVANNGFDERGKVRTGSPEVRVIPRRPGDPSPIKHVIYVIKENRTYDQLFGSLGRGDGDPRLNLFGEQAAPNHRALARQFVTLDNFYAAGEVSADGWEWSTQANANPSLQQNTSASYGGRNHPYDFDGGQDAYASDDEPESAYLWDRLAAKGIAFRNYGFFKNFYGKGVADPTLRERDVADYQAYNLDCPDSPGTFASVSEGCGAPRMTTWLRDFERDVAEGTLPTVELVMLGNDHTAGTTPGYPTPTQYVADNDKALGMMVDAVSHSRYWKDTAILVVEDDAQDGPDHIDAHRTVALAVSPYPQTGRVDSTFYSTVSMLRTLELIVGIRPLSQFDAAATPMLGSFTDAPDFAPYAARVPDVDYRTPNPPDAPLAAASARQDIEHLDRVDSQLFNRAIWKSVRGGNSVMPAPIRGVRAVAEEEREEEEEEEEEEGER